VGVDTGGGDNTGVETKGAAVDAADDICGDDVASSWAGAGRGEYGGEEAGLSRQMT